MSPLQQAILLTSAVFVLGVGMIFGAMSLWPDHHFKIVTVPGDAMSGDDMGVSGKGDDTYGISSVPRS